MGRCSGMHFPVFFIYLIFHLLSFCIHIHLLNIIISFIYSLILVLLSILFPPPFYPPLALKRFSEFLFIIIFILF